MPARRLLLVHAHPDDETLTTGGTIARYTADPDCEVTVVTCTLGEEGEVIGPMLVNSTPTCYNSTLLPSTFPNLTELNVLHKEVGQHC